MTNRTRTLPRPGAGVLLGTQDTPACSNRTTNRTRPEREQDTEQDKGRTGQPHAREQDTLAGLCPCHKPSGPDAVAGWHARKGPLPVLNTLHGMPFYERPAWVDHAYRVRLVDGRWCYIAEPYTLGSDALADLAHLARHGFGVTVTADRARHYPGRTLAVEIVEAPA